MRQFLIIMTAMLMACCSRESNIVAQDTLDYKMNITIDGQTKSVTLVDNAATKALVEKLQQGPVTVTLNSSGGFEIWGALGFSLPASNKQITAQPGDVILYNDSNICIFYGSNSWSYTRLGKIDGLTGNELSTFLKAGQSNISVTLSLTSGVTGWIECYPKSRLAGTLFCGKVNDARDIEGNPKLDEAFELGKKV